MKLIKTIVETDAENLDNAVRTYTQWAESEGIKIFATQTHVTRCGTHLVFTAVLFIDAPAPKHMYSMPRVVERGFCRVCGEDFDTDDLEDIKLDECLDGAMKSGVCRTCERDQ